MLRKFGRWVGSVCLAFLGAASLLAWGCEFQAGDFQCGTAYQGDSKVAQSCDKPHQVCVCRTNWCAVEVDTSVCDAGLRYVEPPFASPDAGIGADHCVEPANAGWIIGVGAANGFCTAEPDSGPTEGGAGGSTSTGSTSTGSTSTGSGTGGAQ